MAMRSSTRRELSKLRELVNFMLRDKKCFFCKKPLLENPSQRDGDSIGAPIACSLTIHHVDGEHSHQERHNKRLAHQTCHKRYSAKLILHGAKVILKGKRVTYKELIAA